MKPPQTFPKIPFIIGPTASGKTDLALSLADHFPIEIISVDSLLVYRGMDIGTSKPSPEERSQIPHHLIDIRDPHEPYSAALFRNDVLDLITRILQAQKIPLLVGGTMMYVNALLNGLSDLPSSDPLIRSKILKESQEKGWPALHEKLSKIDPKYAARIHSNDAQRIHRALEVYEITQTPLSEMLDLNIEPAVATPPHFPYEPQIFVINPHTRSTLHERIATRFHKMLDQGLIEEVQTLKKRYSLTPDLPALRAVGYRQIWAYLDGTYDHPTMVDRAIAATRQLAKRQITWLRSLNKQFPLIWLENSHSDSLQSVINSLS